MHRFFDEVMALGVEGMTDLAGLRVRAGAGPGALPAQERDARALPQRARAGARARWRFNHSPFYLDFLAGLRDYQCTPWGSPNYSVLGWQRPCYLFSDGGHARTFAELMETTEWERYGPGRHPQLRGLHGALRATSRRPFRIQMATRGERRQRSVRSLLG